jgi:hypothetical protein
MQRSHSLSSQMDAAKRSANADRRGSVNSVHLKNENGVKEEKPKFDYRRFLEQMRHRSSAPIARYLKR